MKYLSTVILLVTVTFFTVFAAGNVTHSGIRASKYGLDPAPMPKARGYHNAVWKMNSYFPGTVPTIVWTVSEMWGDDSNECRFYFPNDNNYPTLNISYDDVELSEKYLAYFDTAKIKVYLQIEPAGAEIKTLFDVISKRYGKHTCVIGFGIDLEWYKCHDYDWGKKVTDAEAQEWEKLVKSYNSAYTLFLKHPDKKMTWFPPTYRGGILFNNDCEGRSNKNDPAGFANYQTDFLGSMKAFGDAFYPNPVIFQIGYPSIKTLWANLNPKPQVVGNDIAAQCKSGQDVHIYWVDFGMKDVLPYSDTWVPLPWPVTAISSDPNAVKQNKFSINPEEYINLSVFSVQGKALFSLSGTGKSVLNGLNAWNKKQTTHAVLIYRVGKQGWKYLPSTNISNH